MSQNQEQFREEKFEENLDDVLDILDAEREAILTPVQRAVREDEKNGFTGLDKLTPSQLVERIEAASCLCIDDVSLYLEEFFWQIGDSKELTEQWMMRKPFAHEGKEGAIQYEGLVPHEEKKPRELHAPLKKGFRCGCDIGRTSEWACTGYCVGVSQSRYNTEPQRFQCRNSVVDCELERWLAAFQASRHPLPVQRSIWNLQQRYAVRTLQEQSTVIDDTVVDMNLIKFYKWLVEQGYRNRQQHINIAVANKSERFVSYLLETGVKANLYTLKYALENAPEFLERLQEVCEEKEEGFRPWGSPCRIAVETGNMEAFLFLEKKGYPTETSLHGAVQWKNFEFVRFFVEKRGEKVSESLVVAAAVTGSSQMVQYIDKALVAQTGTSALSDYEVFEAAAASGSVELVKWLWTLYPEHNPPSLELVFDFESCDEGGDAYRMLKLLLQKAEERGLPYNEEELHDAAVRILEAEDDDCLELLIQYGLRDFTTKSDLTKIAAAKGHLDNLTTLVEAGFRYNPFACIKVAWKPDVVRYLANDLTNLEDEDDVWFCQDKAEE